jgi:hypothetical protein
MVFSWYKEHNSSLCTSHRAFGMRAAFRAVPFLNLNLELSEVTLTSMAGVESEE